MKWTKAFRKNAGKEMTVVRFAKLLREIAFIYHLIIYILLTYVPNCLSPKDSTFEFEKRRNRPIRYNRETMESTLRAMKKVSEVRHKRQDMFFKMRMRAHKGMQREQIRVEIKKGEDILAPAAADREKAIAIASKKIVARQRATEGKMQN